MKCLYCQKELQQNGKRVYCRSEECKIKKAEAKQNSSKRTKKCLACDRQINAERPPKYCQTKSCLENRKMKQQNPETSSPHELCLIDNKSILNKTLSKMKQCTPYAVCAICGMLISENDVEWFPESNLTEPFPAQETFSYMLNENGEFVIEYGCNLTLVYSIKRRESKKKGKCVSICKLCHSSKFRHTHSQSNDFKKVPPEIKNLNEREASSLAIATLFCRTFYPPGMRYSYLFMKGNVGFSTKDFHGTLGLLFDPNPKENEIRKVVIVTALRWLTQNNPLYQEFYARCETLFHHFNSSISGGPNQGIPKVSNDLRWEKEPTEFSWIIDDDPQKQEQAANPKNSVPNLNVGYQSSKTEKLEPFVSYNDPQLEAKIFPTLFPYGTGCYSPDPKKEKNKVAQLKLSSYIKIKLGNMIKEHQDYLKWNL